MWNSPKGFLLIGLLILSIIVASYLFHILLEELFLKVAVTTAIIDLIIVSVNRILVLLKSS